MAVEIPVVIDIDKAFDEAALRVDSAMRPLKRKIDANTAQLKLKIGVEYDDAGDAVPKFAKLEDIINKIKTNAKTGASSMAYGMKELSTALDSAKSKLASLNALQQSGVAVDPVRVSSYREAITILTSVIEQRRHEGDLIEKNTQRIIAAQRAEEERRVIIGSEARTFAEMSNRLSALRAQLENLDPKSKEWAVAAKEMVKATDAISKYETKLATVTSKPGSINRMTAELSALEQKWASLSRTQKFDKDGNFKASAQKIIDKYKQLSVEADKYGKTLAQMNSSLRTQSNLFRGLAGYATTYFSLAGLLRFVKQIRDVTGELEYQRVALGHLIQDEEYGAQLFERIKGLAVESPFRITQLVTYTKQLAAYRIEQENLFSTTKMLADVSAGLGVDMNRLILAYGQVRAASILRGQELRQFTEAGIPLVDLLAEKFSELRGEMVSSAEVFKLISERAVPFSMISDIFEDMTEKGGMFYQMQEKQALTLKGRWEKLKDAFDIGLQSIGESKGLVNFNTYMNATLSVLTFLSKHLRIIPKLIESATAAWVAYNVATFIATKRTAALSQAMVRVTAAFKKFSLAFRANPWGIIASGIAALIPLIFSFRKNSDAATQSISDNEKAIEAMNEANKVAKREMSQITRYEQLASITARTAKENTRYSKTINDLRAAFPALIAEIGNENLALTDQVSLLKQASEEKLKAAREDTKNRLDLEKANNEAMLNQQKKDLEKYSAASAAFYKAEADMKAGAAEYNKKISEKYHSGLVSTQGIENEFVTDRILKKRFENARKRYNELTGAWDELTAAIQKSSKEIERLDAVLNPSSATKDYAEWQKQVISLQERMMSLGDTPVFTTAEIGEMNTVYDLSGKLQKRIKDLSESLAGMRSLLRTMPESVGKDALRSDIAKVETTLKIAEAIKAMFGFDFSKDGRSGYVADPFIQMMNDRMKFMKDFKKGYEDLQKYMGQAGALGEESKIMKSRGLSLGLSETEQKRAAEELSQWYQDAIDEAFSQAQRYGAAGTVEDFLAQQISGSTNRAKALRDFQKLIQSLWDAKTDLDTSTMVKNFKKSFKKMKADLKRSSEVKKFYDDILDMTGDTELTQTLTFSVYGNTEAMDFAQRIQQELSRAMASLDEGQLTDELREAMQKQDFGVILANIEKFSPAWQEEIKQMASDSEAFHVKEVNRWLKDLEKVKTFGQRRVQLSRETAKQIALIQASKLPKETKNTMIEGYRTRELKETKKLQYEAFKDSKMYISVFENMDTVSSRMLKNMRARLVALKGEWKDLDPVQIKELQKRIEEIDQQIADRNPFKAYIDGFKAFSTLVRQGRSRSEDETKASEAEAARKVAEANLESAIAALKEAEGRGKVSDELKQQVAAAQEAYDLAAKNADAAQENADEWNKVAQAIANAAAQLSKYADYTESILSATRGVLDAFASEDTIEWFDIASNTLSKVLDGGVKTASGVAKIISGVDVVGGVVETVSGLAGLVAGVWGGVTASKIKKANEEIEDQEKILNSLEKAYDRLEDAMSKSFGSDYIYNFNQQAKVKQAEIDAYNKMIDAERGKGKKADEKKIEEWQEKIKEAEKTMGDMQGKLAEFFAGTDKASAAKDFATAWIDAYKEFSSTTDAIKEKFQDMIQNMITQSLAAKLIQTILDPVFKAIDTMAGDGELTASEIADISDMTLGATEAIDRALSVLMSKLAAAGYNIRQSDSKFTGISRNIASATEESINGLAAGINTQNFYMSYVPTISQDVAAIRAALVGTSAVSEAVTPSQFGDEMFRGQMSRIDENIAEIRGMLKSVITPKSASVNTHCVGMK